MDAIMLDMVAYHEDAMWVIVETAALILYDRS